MVPYHPLNLLERAMHMRNLCLIFLAAAASTACGGRGIPPATANAWLAKNSRPAAINITGKWNATEWGAGTIKQTGNKFTGDLGGYPVRGSVSGNRVRLLFLTGGSIWWTGELEPINDNTLRGHYSASGAMLSPGQGTPMQMKGKLRQVGGVGLVVRGTPPPARAIPAVAVREVPAKKRPRTRAKKPAKAKKPPVAKKAPPAEDQQPAEAPDPAAAPPAEQAPGPKVWFYAVGLKKHGPVSGAEVRARLKAKEIGADSLVWRKGMKDWPPLGKVKALAP